MVVIVSETELLLLTFNKKQKNKGGYLPRERHIPTLFLHPSKSASLSTTLRKLAQLIDASARAQALRAGLLVQCKTDRSGFKS